MKSFMNYTLITDLVIIGPALSRPALPKATKSSKPKPLLPLGVVGNIVETSQETARKLTHLRSKALNCWIELDGKAV